MQLKFLILAICVSVTLASLSPPGKNYNPDRVKVSGQRSISLLGTFNGTNIYLGSDLVKQDLAKSDCEAAGLKLGTFNQAYLNYIYTVTNSNEDYLWTSGTHHYGPSAFIFEDGSSIDPAIQLNAQTDNHPEYGLIIDRYPDDTHLRVSSSSQFHAYLCYSEAS